mgnify:CR=1 FL=1
MTTTDDILGHIKTQLAYARSDVKQAQLRGYSPEYYMGRVAAYAGLIAFLDPKFKTSEEGSKFVEEMFDFTDVPEYYRPGGAA